MTSKLGAQDRYMDSGLIVTILGSLPGVVVAVGSVAYPQAFPKASPAAHRAVFFGGLVLAVLLFVGAFLFGAHVNELPVAGPAKIHPAAAIQRPEVAGNSGPQINSAPQIEAKQSAAPRVSQQSRTVDDRKALRSKFTEFASEGEVLVAGCSIEGATNEPQARDWLGRVQAYVTNNLGRSYYDRLLDQSGLTIFPEAPDARRAKTCRNLWVVAYNIGRLLDEMQSTNSDELDNGEGLAVDLRGKGTKIGKLVTEGYSKVLRDTGENNSVGEINASK